MRKPFCHKHKLTINFQNFGALTLNYDIFIFLLCNYCVIFCDILWILFDSFSPLTARLTSTSLWKCAFLTSAMASRSNTAVALLKVWVRASLCSDDRFNIASLMACREQWVTIIHNSHILGYILAALDTQGGKYIIKISLILLSINCTKKVNCLFISGCLKKKNRISPPKLPS